MDRLALPQHRSQTLKDEVLFRSRQVLGLLSILMVMTPSQRLLATAQKDPGQLAAPVSPGCVCWRVPFFQLVFSVSGKPQRTASFFGVRIPVHILTFVLALPSQPRPGRPEPCASARARRHKGRPSPPARRTRGPRGSSGSPRGRHSAPQNQDHCPRRRNPSLQECLFERTVLQFKGTQRETTQLG